MRCPALACFGMRSANYNWYKIVSFKGTKREKKHTLLRLKRVPRPALACVGLRWPSLAVVGRCGPALACVGLRPAKYNLYKIVSFKGTKREKKHTLLRLKRVPRPALACVGLRWPSLAAVGLRWPALACVGLRPAKYTLYKIVSFKRPKPEKTHTLLTLKRVPRPALACVGLRWTSLAVVGRCGPSLTCAGLRWPSLAAVGLR